MLERPNRRSREMWRRGKQINSAQRGGKPRPHIRAEHGGLPRAERIEFVRVATLNETVIGERDSMPATTKHHGGYLRVTTSGGSNFLSPG